MNGEAGGDEKGQARDWGKEKGDFSFGKGRIDGRTCKVNWGIESSLWEMDWQFVHGAEVYKVEDYNWPCWAGKAVQNTEGSWLFSLINRVFFIASLWFWLFSILV